MMALPCTLSGLLPEGFAPVIRPVLKSPHTRRVCPPPPQPSDSPFPSQRFRVRPLSSLSRTRPLRPSSVRSSSSSPPSSEPTCPRLLSACEQNSLVFSSSSSTLHDTHRWVPRRRLLFCFSFPVSHCGGASSPRCRHDDGRACRSWMLCPTRGLASRRHAKTVKLNTVHTLGRAKNAYKQHLLRHDPHGTSSHFVLPSSSSSASSELALPVAAPVPVSVRPPSKRQLRSPYVNPYLYSSSLSPAPLPSLPPVLFHKVVLVDDALAQSCREARIRKLPLGNVKKLKAFELTAALCTYGQAYIQHKPLWSELIQECMRRYKEFSVSEASWVLHAFAEAHDRRRRRRGRLGKSLFFSSESSPDAFFTPSLQETCRRLTRRITRDFSLLTLPDAARILHATAKLEISDLRLLRTLSCLIPQLLPSWSSGVRTPQETHRILQLLVSGFAGHGLHCREVFAAASETYSSHIDRWVDARLKKRRRDLRRARKERRRVLSSSTKRMQEAEKGKPRSEGEGEVLSFSQEGDAEMKSRKKDKPPVIFRLRDVGEDEEGGIKDGTVLRGGGEGAEQALSALLPKAHRIVSLLQAFARLQFRSDQLIFSVRRLLHASVPAYHGVENSTPAAVSSTSSSARRHPSRLYQSSSFSCPSVSSAAYWGRGRSIYRYRYAERGRLSRAHSSASHFGWGHAPPSSPRRQESSQSVLRHLLRSSSSSSSSSTSSSLSSCPHSSSSHRLSNSEGLCPTLYRQVATPVPRALEPIPQDASLPSLLVPSPPSILRYGHPAAQSRRAKTRGSLPPGSEASLASTLLIAPRQLLRRRSNEGGAVSSSSPCISLGCPGFAKKRRKPIAQAEKEKSRAGRFQKRVDWRRMLHDTLAVHIPPNTRSPFVSRRGQVHGGGLSRRSFLSRRKELEAKRAVAWQEEIQRQLQAWTLAQVGSVLSSLARVGVSDPHLTTLWKEGLRHSLHEMSLEELTQNLGIMKSLGVYGRALRYRVWQRLRWFLDMKTGRVTDAEEVVRLGLALTDMPAGPLGGEQEFSELLAEVRRRLTRTARTWLLEQEGEDALRDVYRILVRNGDIPAPSTSESRGDALRSSSSLLATPHTPAGETADVTWWSSSSPELLCSSGSPSFVKPSSLLPVPSARTPGGRALPTSSSACTLPNSVLRSPSTVPRLPLQSPAALFPWRPVEAAFPSALPPSLLPSLLHVVVSLFPFSSPIPLELLLPRARLAAAGASLPLRQLHQMVRDLRSWVQLYRTAGLGWIPEVAKRDFACLCRDDGRYGETNPNSSSSPSCLGSKREQKLAGCLPFCAGTKHGGSCVAQSVFAVSSADVSRTELANEDRAAGVHRERTDREPDMCSGLSGGRLDGCEEPSGVFPSPGELRRSNALMDTAGMIEETEAAIWHTARLRVRLLLSTLQRRLPQRTEFLRDEQVSSSKGNKAVIGVSEGMRESRGLQASEEDSTCGEATKTNAGDSCKTLGRNADEVGRKSSGSCLTDLANHGVLLVSRRPTAFLEGARFKTRSGERGRGQRQKEEECPETQGGPRIPGASLLKSGPASGNVACPLSATTEFSGDDSKRQDRGSRESQLFLTAADGVCANEEALLEASVVLNEIRTSVRLSRAEEETGELNSLNSRKASSKYHCVLEGPFRNLNEALAVLAMETAPYASLLLSQEPFVHRRRTSLQDGTSREELKTGHSNNFQTEPEIDPTVVAPSRSLWEPAPDILSSLVSFLSSCLLFATKEQILEATRLALAVLRHPVWLRRLETELFLAARTILGSHQETNGACRASFSSPGERQRRWVQQDTVPGPSCEVCGCPGKDRDRRRPDGSQSLSERNSPNADTNRYRTFNLNGQGEHGKTDTENRNRAELRSEPNAEGLRRLPREIPGPAVGESDLDVWENLAAVATLLLQQQQRVRNAYRADDLLLLVADLLQVSQGIRGAFKGALGKRLLLSEDSRLFDAKNDMKRRAIEKVPMEALDMLFGNSLQLVQHIEETALPGLLNRLREAPQIIHESSPTVALRVALQAASGAHVTGGNMVREEPSKRPAADTSSADGRPLWLNRNQLHGSAGALSIPRYSSIWLLLERLAALSAGYPFAVHSAIQTGHTTAAARYGSDQRGSEALRTGYGAFADSRPSLEWGHKSTDASECCSSGPGKKALVVCTAACSLGSAQMDGQSTRSLPGGTVASQCQHIDAVAYATSPTQCGDTTGEAVTRVSRENKGMSRLRHGGGPRLRRGAATRLLQELLVLYRKLRSLRDGEEKVVTEKWQGYERVTEWSDIHGKSQQLWRAHGDVAVLVVLRLIRSHPAFWSVFDRVEPREYGSILARS